MFGRTIVAAVFAVCFAFSSVAFPGFAGTQDVSTGQAHTASREILKDGQNPELADGRNEQAYTKEKAGKTAKFNSPSVEDADSITPRLSENFYEHGRRIPIEFEINSKKC
jgi:hypothetical protein